MSNELYYTAEEVPPTATLQERVDTLEKIVTAQASELERMQQLLMDLEPVRREQKEKERVEKKRLEKERVEKEQLEKERLEKYRLEKERLEKERLEEKQKQEAIENERLRLEKERMEAPEEVRKRAWNEEWTRAWNEEWEGKQKLHERLELERLESKLKHSVKRGDSYWIEHYQRRIAPLKAHLECGSILPMALGAVWNDPRTYFQKDTP